MKTAKDKHCTLLNTAQICERLAISPRTLNRRLIEDGWQEGYGFFKYRRSWYIREDDLDIIIQGMENNFIRGRHVRKSKINSNDTAQ